MIGSMHGPDLRNNLPGRSWEMVSSTRNVHVAVTDPLSDDSLFGRLILLRPEQMTALRHFGLDQSLEERTDQGGDED